MRVKDLIEKLQTFPAEAEVWVHAVNNEGIPTYALLDCVFDFHYEDLYRDLFPTPGEIDKRIFRKREETEEPIVISLSSTFGY